MSRQPDSTRPQSATTPEAAPVSKLQSTVGRAHLVGVAGAGMRSLARVLAQQNWLVTGSDASGQAVQAAHQVYPHHSAEVIDEDLSLLVYSAAVEDDNPERRRAVELGIPTFSYAAMLGRLCRGRCGLAVAGTHGKSTVTAMAAEILIRARLDPTVVCGAAPPGRDDGGRAGRGGIALVEACEYRSNFLHLRPELAVITGVEPDHFDSFATDDELDQAFRRFAGGVALHGLLLVGGDCPRALRTSRSVTCRRQTFGLVGANDWTVADVREQQGRYRFSIVAHGKPLATIRLQVPGRHNVLNALAAAALCYEAGAPADAVAEGLENFAGLRRRLELRGTACGAALVEDYAHHPTEIDAAIASVRQMYPGRRLWVVFQPHQTSRTGRLLDELARSLHNADKLAVAEIYRARENLAQRPTVTSADLARQVRAAGGDVLDAHRYHEIVHHLREDLRAGDVLLVMGPGDIGKLCDELGDGD